MIAEGLLDDPTPEAAFALHVFPNVPGGIVACRAGALLASADTIAATIRGKGGHAAMPHDAIDPVPIACEAVLALQAHVARRTTFTDPVVLSITKIAGGTAHNVIPDEVELLGTMRTLSDKARDRDARSVRAHRHRGSPKRMAPPPRCAIDEGYPPTVNDPRAVALIRALATEQFGDGAYVEVPAPIMGAEDFSYVLQKVPGAMAILGVAPPDGDPFARAPIHNAKMLVDEAVLPRGVAMHCAFAMRFLERGWD